MTEQRVLIVDDEPDIRELLEITLLRMGLDTHCAANVKEAIHALNDFQPHICLTDMKLPDGSGVDIVRYINKQMPTVPVAVITAFGSMETAVEALKAGAFDFVSKPVDLKKLRELIETALKMALKKGKQVTQPPVASVTETDDPGLILGQSKAIKRLLKTINKLSRSQAPVYINGESGSGKELVAKSIHLSGPHRDRPFVPVNCGAIPENLVESEFFGHVKGSFSGAVTDKQGLFQAAAGGTLFLDEVADLPLEMQVKLLRAIQEKAIKPVGGTAEIPVNVRILSATHKNLEREVASRRFRQDLYYRLNVIKLEVPPLRHRGDDILLLAKYFLKQISEQWGLEPASLSHNAVNALLDYSFPGNVRELVNILERAYTLSDHNSITAKDLQLPKLEPSVQYKKHHPETVSNEEEMQWQKGNVSDREEKRMIERALQKTHWNRTKAAEELGMTLRQLRYRIQKYKLENYESEPV